MSNEIESLKSRIKDAQQLATNILFESGLSDDEFNEIEKQFNVIFPPDWKLFLSVGLPVSLGFPNWRAAIRGDQEAINFIRDYQNFIKDGFYFDIENNEFYLDASDKDLSIDKRKEKVSNAIDEAPPMVQVYLHRFIPSRPCENGNPIFSIYQTDIIIYGKNVPSYLRNEFHMEIDWPGYSEDLKYIDFYSDFLNF